MASAYLLIVFTHVLACLVAQMVKNSLAMQKAWVRSMSQKIPWRREGQPIPVFLPSDKNPMDRGVWRATDHRVTKSQTWLNGFHFHFTFWHLRITTACFFTCYRSLSGASINSRFSLRIKSNSEEPESTSTQSLYPSWVRLSFWVYSQQLACPGVRSWSRGHGSGLKCYAV